MRADPKWPKSLTQVSRFCFSQYLHVVLTLELATQSYALLVEKFRNSPVMLDFPDNRPKVSVSLDNK